MDSNDDIRAEHTFFERSRIDKKKADTLRESPDVNEMYGAVIVEPMAGGGDKVTYYYWKTAKRRRECLPRVSAKYVNPTITLL